MPKRTDLKKILIIGSGPIIIGQAGEFDYSGTQAVKALREEGFEVILVNSNPATIMTDPEFADKTYIEPITPEILEKIIEREKPDALLPTLGGQTGLNVATTLYERGVLKNYHVEMIGAKYEAIKKAEDRILFKNAMQKIGLDLPRSGFATTLEEALKISGEIGFPIIVRPAYTLGGTGGGIAYDLEELKQIVFEGLKASQIHQVLLEESVIGWKEYELEVMRDLKDNVVIICSIENFDPMGVHTGDSITVAPAQTLTDKEYQRLRDYSLAVMREIGVETGGSNIQFAVNPEDGRVVIIEMNPRVSRSSALASKATGFPIAKMAAKLAVGYTLDEIPNDITKKTPASFEPTIDYVVTKIPRFAFEKFAEADATLTTKMKSVGEIMAIGRTFKESLQKALRSLEVGMAGLEDPKIKREAGEKVPLLEDKWLQPESLFSKDLIIEKLKKPNWERIFYLKKAFEAGFAVPEIFELSKIDPWFLAQVQEIVAAEAELKTIRLKGENKMEANQGENKLTLKNFGEILLKAKRHGFSDRQLAKFWQADEMQVRQLRKKIKILPVYKTVDTCAAEFEAFTPYYYSTYETENESIPTDRKKVIILGGGPYRIGQGIEFDYCCVHGAFALREDGFETIMVNSNPETVSTDYDTSDRLYFEPLTLEDVLNIYEHEKPLGVIVQFGGQTPLNLAVPLVKAGVKILGTSSESINRAEDRGEFAQMLKKLSIPQPENGIAFSVKEAKAVARKIGYPLLVRPSYVLGGRAMEIIYDEPSLENYTSLAVEVTPRHPILIDKFLEDALEIDVDALCDAKRCLICGIMEHIEEAGIHSGDSACVLPSISISEPLIKIIKEYTKKMALELEVKGLINIQFAIKNNEVYVLECNPRASRTVPFVSKATGVAWAKMAARIMTGRSITDLNLKEIIPRHLSVKEVVLPFSRFNPQDTVLGPEMRSTGEVMGIDENFGLAFAKAELAAGENVPTAGRVFLSVRDRDKKDLPKIAKKFFDLGFQITATRGTAEYLKKHGISVEVSLKVIEGWPNVTDEMRAGKIQIVINTPSGRGSRSDDYLIRRTALNFGILRITTIAAARAIVAAIEALQKENLKVKAIQEYF